ncbi:MAG: DUF1345 domain-containing protein [Anaerolineae bacterium]
MHSLYQPRVRGLVALAAGLLALALARLVIDWDSAVLMAWDVGVFVWLAVTFTMIMRASAQWTGLHAQRLEPNGRVVLIVVAAAAIVGYVGSIILASRSGGRSQVDQVVHFVIGILAIAEGFLLVHTQFALYYAEMYYDEKPPEAEGEGESMHGLAPFRRGLEFPNAELIDYWDFIYFSYTIAICYQTSDVTVGTPKMRRVTIAHALISFVFVTVLIGFVVNALNNFL